MEIIYAKEDFPKSFKSAIFLAGPTPRSDDLRSWRPEAIRILKEKGYSGIVFVPEERNGQCRGEYESQIAWEEKGLNLADCIIFWVPRDLEKMPAFTTNVEYGEWFKSGKIILGAPKNAPNMKYLKTRGEKFLVPQLETLKDTIDAALKMIGEGALRCGGECCIPLHIWNTPSFKSWYEYQKSAGNRIDNAEVKWVSRTGPGRKFVFLWILHVNIFIAAENRNKTNEFVISRPDISTVFMYKKGKDIRSSTVVLIREFRSPVSTPDGYVWELPGGSSLKDKASPFVLASDEAYKETGLRIDASRMKMQSARQLIGTLSAHKAHLFSVEISEYELNWLRQQVGLPHGIETDTERTYIEIRTVEEILSEPLVDWSMIGMILSVLTKEFGRRKKWKMF